MLICKIRVRRYLFGRFNRGGTLKLILLYPIILQMRDKLLWVSFWSLWYLQIILNCCCLPLINCCMQDDELINCCCMQGESYNYKDVVVLSQYSIEENVSFNQKEREKV